MSRKLWVIGTPYSGTRYLYWLLDENTTGEMESFDGRAKHVTNQDIKEDDIHPAIIYKHPIAWMPSVWNRRGEGQRSAVATLVRWWTMSYDAWLQRFPEAPFVDHMDLLTDPEETMEKAIDKLGVEKSDKWFKNTKKQPMKPRQTFSPERYLDHQFLDDYSNGELKTAERFTERLASDVLDRLEYEGDL